MNVNVIGVFLGCKYGLWVMKVNLNGLFGFIINLLLVMGLCG